MAHQAGAAASTSSDIRPAVVVLNWQQYDETRECLASLTRLKRPAKLYLVDNASNPSSLQALLADFPTVTGLPLSENLGFAEGMNRGIRQALDEGATHVLLFNNDARATPALLDQLLAMYGAQKDVGVVGPSLRYLPPDPRVQSAGIDINLFTGRVHLRGVDVAPELLYPYPHKVDAVPGTAMLVSAKVFEAVGLLTSDYYFYYEDLDLCLRAREKGLFSYMVPGAVAYHRGGFSMGQAPERAYYAVRNQLRLLCAHGVKLPTPLRWLRSVVVAGMNGAQVVQEGHGISPAHLQAWVQGLQDYLQKRNGPRP